VPPATDVLIEAGCGANLIIGSGATVTDWSAKAAMVPVSSLSPIRFPGMESTGASEWGSIIAAVFTRAFRITTGGYLSWGPGDGSHLLPPYPPEFDASFHRVSAGLMEMLAVLRIKDTTQHLASSVWGSMLLEVFKAAFRITSTGYQSWGPGDDTYDVSMFRDSAGFLKILGGLTITDVLHCILQATVDGLLKAAGGLEISGQAVTFGANDSGGSGYRLVRVPNI
jgi:hypothetical protein